jgi:hypothetical protein
MVGKSVSRFAIWSEFVPQAAARMKDHARALFVPLRSANKVATI